jgi:hypothetical protein
LEVVGRRFCPRGEFYEVIKRKLKEASRELKAIFSSLLTLVGRVFNFVKIPPSSITASSTIPRVPKVLVGSPLPSATVYCAETLVDLASQSVTAKSTANKSI